MKLSDYIPEISIYFFDNNDMGVIFYKTKVISLKDIEDCMVYKFDCAHISYQGRLISIYRESHRSAKKTNLVAYISTFPKVSFKPDTDIKKALTSLIKKLIVSHPYLKTLI